MGYMTDLKKAQDDNNIDEVLRLQDEHQKKGKVRRKEGLLKKYNGLTFGEFAKGKVNNFNNVEGEFSNQPYDDKEVDIVSGEGYVFYLYELNGKIEFGDIICFHGNENILLYNKVTKEFKEEHTR